MLPSKPNISQGGMLASYPLVSKIESEMLGMLLALSAGALLLGAPHLLPRAEQENKRLSLIALAGGVLVAFIIVVSKA